MEESLNTLKYANRARDIRNLTYVNYQKEETVEEVEEVWTDEAHADAQTQEQQTVLHKLTREVDACKREAVMLSDKLKRAEEKNEALQVLGRSNDTALALDPPNYSRKLTGLHFVCQTETPGSKTGKAVRCHRDRTQVLLRR